MNAMFIIYRERFFLKLVFLLFMLVATTNAQSEFNYTEFRVSESDLQNSYYPKDSTANALVIYEYGKSFVREDDFDIVTDYKKKIKIFNRKGFDKGTIELYLYKNDNHYEKVINVVATTYNKLENGTIEITKLGKEHIYKEDYNEHNDLLKFTLPKLKEGSVITFSYRVISPFIFNFYEWTFQEDIPKLYSEYNTKIPANYTYNIKIVGWQKLDENEQKIERDCVTHGTASADCVVAKYVMKDIAAFTTEKYMTTKKNYISKLEYELMTVKYFDGTERNYTKSWKTVDSEIKGVLSLGRALRKTKHLKALIPIEVLKGLEGVEKANKIYQYVKNNYTFDEEQNVFDDISTKDLIQDKNGSVTEINTLLNGLLELNGFKTNLVLMSTRSNGLPTKLFPVISEFNYSVVRVEIDGKEYLLDASSDFLVFGQIPFKCLNEYGRKLDFKEGSSWLPISVKDYSSTMNYVELKMDTTNALVGTIKTRYTGYHAYNKKEKYYSNKSVYKDNLENQFVNMTVEDHKVLSKGIEDNRFQETIYVKSDKFEGENEIFLDPFIEKFFEKNPFKLKNRTYPVDFGYKDSYTYTLILDVGEIYDIVEAPKNIRMKLLENKGEFSMLSTVSGSKLRLTFRLKFHESVYTPYFYESLKELMNNVVAKQTKSIVLLKKKG
jgi:hypothetical protein